MFKKVLGYYRQIPAGDYKLPAGLKGGLEKCKLHLNGKVKEIMMSPVGRSVWTFPFHLPWFKKPILVAHCREDAKGKWQVDEAVTGMPIVSGYNTSAGAVAAAESRLERCGEDAFWKEQKAVCRAMRKANVRLNQVEIVT